MEQELLSVRRSQLIEIIENSFGNCEPHSQALAIRLLGESYASYITKQINTTNLLEEATYGGYPVVASLGFVINQKIQSKAQTDSIAGFITSITRLQQRPETGLASFIMDDVAILGIADGLNQIEGHDDVIESSCQWLTHIINNSSKQNLWSFRMRDLAGDLLDKKGRLRVSLTGDDHDANALEIVLRNIWPEQYAQTQTLSHNEQTQLLMNLLTAVPPQVGDLEKTVVWLRAIDLLVGQACEALIPSISDVSRILRSIQHSFKRWVWEDNKLRTNADPAKWLIDREAHIQSLLWAILYPIYGPHLVDEAYLPNWGHKQPRADLGITSLKLIIEVKYARQPADFKKIEGEVGDDVGLYFKDTDLFDKMIAFIYDDCDQHRPEKYDGLKNALMKREHIEDVIIIRRPGMITPRNARTF